MVTARTLAAEDLSDATVLEGLAPLKLVVFALGCCRELSVCQSLSHSVASCFKLSNVRSSLMGSPLLSFAHKLSRRSQRIARFRRPDKRTAPTTASASVIEPLNLHCRATNCFTM